MCSSDEAGVTQQGGKVVVFSAEDDAGDTLRPRYDIAGADVSKIIHVDGVRRMKPDGSSERHAFNLERDIETLRALLAEHRDVVFVRIDPVTAYLGRIDSHKNAEVRALLAQLEEVAREFRIAIAVVTHLNKSAPDRRSIASSEASPSSRHAGSPSSSPEIPRMQTGASSFPQKRTSPRTSSGMPSESRKHGMKA